MRKRVLAVGLAAVMMSTAMTGCVKVIKIGQEAEYTGKTEFNAGDDVAGIWESKALPDLEGKAVDLAEFLTEANGDVKSLVDKYGKYSMGTSGEINYVVKVTGTVTEVNRTDLDRNFFRSIIAVQFNSHISCFLFLIYFCNCTSSLYNIVDLTAGSHRIFSIFINQRFHISICFCKKFCKVHCFAFKIRECL